MLTNRQNLPITLPLQRPLNNRHPLPGTHHLALHQAHLSFRHGLQIRNAQSPRDACVLPVSGFGNRCQSAGGTNVEDCGGAAAVEVSEAVAVGGEDGEAEYCSSYGRGGGGDEL